MLHNDGLTEAADGQRRQIYTQREIDEQAPRNRRKGGKDENTIAVEKQLSVSSQ